MSRFTDPMGAVPVTATPAKPTEAQIAATGRALPAGAHTLTPAQQRAWFGRVVFTKPVAWAGDAFVSDGEQVTPAQMAGSGG